MLIVKIAIDARLVKSESLNISKEEIKSCEKERNSRRQVG
jgi:hypothetical protein